MRGNALVIGADDRLSMALERLIPGIRVRSARTAAETEGRGVDVVVIAGEHPIETLSEIRVHPNLHATPVVLFCPGHRMDVNDWRRVDVWPVTRLGFDAVDDLIEYVARTLARLHPVGTGQTSVGSVPAA